MKSFLIALLLAPLFALSQTLTVNSPITLTSGNYGVVEVKDGSDIIVDGVVYFGNMNPLNSHDVKLTITKKGFLTIGSSLNQNGKFYITNNGHLVTGNHELQSGTNLFQNNGVHTINGDMQLSSGGSKYTNCGVVTVSNAFNLHSGEYEACNCGQIKASIMNVNGSKKVSGKGFIEITNTINLNGFLTDSPHIVLCYKGNLNQPEKVGQAQRSCIPSCDPLPVSYEYVRAARLSPSQVKISFKVTDHNNAVRYRILKSTDGKNFTSAGVIDADKANPNRVYEFTINTSEK